MTAWTPTFIIGGLTAVAALAGVLVAIFKVRPENARAIVAAATELADDQLAWGRQMKADAADAVIASREMKAQMSQLHDELSQARAEIATLRREHAAEVATLTRERDEERAMVAEMRGQVALLRAEVAGLRVEIAARTNPPD